MSTTTPPGWYPDPGHTDPGSAPDRWWDGSAWTEHTRLPPAVHDPTATLPDPGGRPSHGPLVAAVIAAAVVVTALIAGGLLLLGGADGPGDRPGTPDTASGTSDAPDGPSDDGEPDGRRPESDTPGTAVDRVNGVGVPLLPGWRETETDRGLWLSTGSYSCPGDTALTCVRGGVSLRPATDLAGTTPREMAEEDIVRNAEESYDDKAYGGIESHEVVASGEVTVAGRRGYRVRWRIANELEPDAYVESVVFPAPDGDGPMLLLRLGFDVHAEAPDQGDMDRIVAGVRATRGPGMAV
ncbi:DUF2510 domain-containing protein [Streptomyces megasporus]|uniref:DUF2510 domain-containing protein n=1 Tax=Streptomyces megasporus TaxID=44060 RepID=UPI0004E20219|nr:DUF2510 domain-containing protein [Streptomyces megasporus]